jgi:hypothetical protein
MLDSSDAVTNLNNALQSAENARGKRMHHALQRAELLLGHSVDARLVVEIFSSHATG